MLQIEKEMGRKRRRVDMLFARRRLAAQFRFRRPPFVQRRLDLVRIGAQLAPAMRAPDPVRIHRTMNRTNNEHLRWAHLPWARLRWARLRRALLQNAGARIFFATSRLC